MSDIQVSDVAFSENLGEFAKAMSAVQGEIQNPKKTSENPYFKSRYADLAECIDASRSLLAKNQIACVQLTVVRGDRAGCVTKLVHSSGQWVQCTTLLKPAKDDPQAMGSCFTYARRYALQGLLGIAGEDDDGNAASQSNGHANGKAEQRQRKPKESMPKQGGEYTQCYIDTIRKPFEEMSKTEDFQAAWPGGMRALQHWVTSNKIANVTDWWQVATCEDQGTLDQLKTSLLLETSRRAEEAKKPVGAA